MYKYKKMSTHLSEIIKKWTKLVYIINTNILNQIILRYFNFLYNI